MITKLHHLCLWQLTNGLNSINNSKLIHKVAKLLLQYQVVATTILHASRHEILIFNFENVPTSKINQILASQTINLIIYSCTRVVVWNIGNAELSRSGISSIKLITKLIKYLSSNSQHKEME